MITRNGSQPSTPGPADNFVGDVRVQPLFTAEDTAPYTGALVAFQPGARSAWHTHPAGRRLIVTDGIGRTQQEGGPAEEIRAGDLVWWPPGISPRPGLAVEAAGRPGNLV